MMICGNCNKIGIHWVGPCGNLTGTKCPHCGGENCQIVDPPEEDEEHQARADAIYDEGIKSGRVQEL